MAVQGADAHPRALSDRPYGRTYARFDKHRRRRVHQRFDVVPGIGAETTRLQVASTAVIEVVIDRAPELRGQDDAVAAALQRLTLAGAEVALTDEVLDRIDEIVPPGESIGAMDMVYRGPEVGDPALRRRPATQRAAI